MWLVLLLACGTPAPDPAPAEEGSPIVSGTDTDVETAFAPVWEAARRGDIAEADRLATTIVAAFEASPDAGFTRAVAHAQQSQLRVAVGDYSRALTSLEAALAVEPATEADREARLSFLAMAVDALLRADEPQAAVRHARTGLTERLALYPEVDHPGRAFGHRTLANALMASGETAEATEQARLALEIFRAADHDGVNDTVLLLGQLQVQAGRPVSLPEVPLDPVELSSAVNYRMQAPGWETLLPVLSALVGPHPTERLHGARASVAWRTDELDVARESAAWILEHGSPQGQLEAGAMLATLEEQQGDRAAAEAAYRRACDQAEGELKARCFRELGVFLVGDPMRVDAARVALGEAAEAQDPEVRGRALAALGILEAHDGTTEAARTALEGAVAALPPAHPDADFARNHLRTLGTGDCGCGDPGRSFEDTLMAYASTELPGLVQAVALDAEGAVQLTLAREATAEEEAALADLQERVFAEVRYRSRQLYGE